MFLEVPRRCYSASRASHLRLAVSSTRQLPERFSVRRPQEGQDTKQANRPISFGASTEPSSLLAAMMSLLVPTCKLTFPILTDLYTCASQSCNTAPHTKPRPVCHVSNISILPDPCWLQKKKILIWETWGRGRSKRVWASESRETGFKVWISI